MSNKKHPMLLLTDAISTHLKNKFHMVFSPGGVGRRHIVLKCFGLVLHRSEEAESVPEDGALEFWDAG